MQKAIKRWFPLFVVPTVVAFIISFIAPFAMGIYLSFTKFKTVSNAKWVGFSNYLKAFRDDTFMHAFGFTAQVAVTSLVLINVLAFLVAYALTREIRGVNLFRADRV